MVILVRTLFTKYRSLIVKGLFRNNKDKYNALNNSQIINTVDNKVYSACTTDVLPRKVKVIEIM